MPVMVNLRTLSQNCAFPCRSRRSARLRVIHGACYAFKSSAIFSRLAAISFACCLNPTEKGSFLISHRIKRINVSVVFSLHFYLVGLSTRHHSVPCYSQLAYLAYFNPLPAPCGVGSKIVPIMSAIILYSITCFIIKCKMSSTCCRISAGYIKVEHKQFCNAFVYLIKLRIVLYILGLVVVVSCYEICKLAGYKIYERRSKRTMGVYCN